MTINKPTWSQIRSWLRELAAVIGLVLSVSNAISWPPAIRGTVLLVSGVLLAVEHGAQKLLDPNTAINVAQTGEAPAPIVIASPSPIVPTPATPNASGGNQ